MLSRHTTTTTLRRWQLARGGRVERRISCSVFCLEQTSQCTGPDLLETGPLFRKNVGALIYEFSGPPPPPTTFTRHCQGRHAWRTVYSHVANSSLPCCQIMEKIVLLWGPSSAEHAEHAEICLCQCIGSVSVYRLLTTFLHWRAVHILYNAKIVFWTTHPPYATLYNISLTHPQCYIAHWNDTPPQKWLNQKLTCKTATITVVSSMWMWNFTHSLIPLRLGAVVPINCW